MKKLIAFIFAILVLASCENMKFDYKDYDSQAVYFPFQYPVRTLSLGNDIIDNSLDKQHKFHIGVSIGGLYAENSKSWTVDYVVDNTLVENYLVNASNDTLRVLPASYYTINPTEVITIPKGSFSGLIEVQLTDAFFSDPKAIKGSYVIPLKITATSADSILIGKAITAPADRHIVANWVSQQTPKDYTLFGIKYVNPYHGKWLRRCEIVEKDPTNTTVISTTVIRNTYVERDQIVALNTNSMSEVISNYVGNLFTSTMSLTVAGTAVTIKPVSGAALAATGTGTFKAGGESWGGKPYDAIYLNYTYTLANGNKCSVMDTLVFRDRAIIVQEARPTVVIPAK
ncbi:MAG TPA: DUF1735 domain-containing protein [Bacteroidales bacterium]|nr:DUF1735 domain-containing protein [Bacteroidales bacterium]